MCANQESAAAAWPFLADHPPVIVDWLPWNHTFGGNHNFNMMLRHGGTLYIDEGKPVPALIGRTIANLREVSPTVYFNVPRGYAALLDHLETDEALQQTVLRAPRSAVLRGGRPAAEPVGPAGGAGPEGARPQGAVHLVVGPDRDGAGRDHGALHDRPAGQHRRAGAGHRRCSSCPTATSSRSASRGPTSRPATSRAPELTAKAFDEEGWLRTGDAVRLADAGQSGRTACCSTAARPRTSSCRSGTWVNVGMLRTAVIAAGAPVIEDAVVTGHDRDEIGLLIFPSLAGLRSLCPDARRRRQARRAGRRAGGARGAGRRGSRATTRAAQGSSMRIARCLLLTEPPSHRRQRDHRQGLPQPARGADQARRAGRAAARRAGRRPT